MTTPPKRWLRHLMSWPDRLRYMAWRQGLIRGSLRVRLEGDKTIIIRRPPTGDLDAAVEIFVFDVYHSPRLLPADSIQRIVDLGSNVGYSIVEFAHQFPSATIEAYEPHPAHVAQIEQNLDANGLTGRVRVHPVAVSNHSGHMFLTDEETQSRLTETGGDGRIEVEVQDWLGQVNGARIDLLKMDIEGGETAILFDPRFEKLDLRNIVLEWHEPRDSPGVETRIIERLQSLGFQTEAGLQTEFEHLRCGLLWGYRS